MCDAVRQYAQEYAQEYVQEFAVEKDKETAFNLYCFGMSIDLIAKALKREPAMVKSWIMDRTEMKQ